MRFLTKEKECETYAEDNRKTARHVIKGNLDILQAQVIESDHTDEDQRQGENRHAGLSLEFRDMVAVKVRHKVLFILNRHLACLLSDQTQQVADEASHNALPPRQEKRGGDALVLVAQQELVQVNHRDGHEPVGAYH